MFAAWEKAYPCGPRIETPGYRVRHDKVPKTGNVTLRYRGRLHHIGIGNPYRGWRVVLLGPGAKSASSPSTDTAAATHA